MTTAQRPRVPIKPGYFTIPDDPKMPPKLLGTKCNACGEHYFPRRAICARPECLSENTVDVALGPRGTLYSYTFVHLPLFGSSNMEHAEGYGVGQVDMPEGPRVQLPLAGKQGEFKIGQTLEAELNTLREDGANDIVIVRFRPVEG
ncbi:MAG TPA: OB-fold domain-containing protein [Candidatus Acidoferrales bacterium]|nr:OB-fold domain-containing protein [Candidatus Acidoferrales bacterium]